MNGSWAKVTTKGLPFDAFVPDDLPETLTGWNDQKETLQLLKQAETSF